ncbi:MAG: endonuclease MutS2 [Oscillospiraceae bacterium]|nr:endonuclease MutS2 [Oscillospiraceae bacterium]
MSELFDKSIHTLELPTVLRMLADQASSGEARERALKTVPQTNLEDVARLQDETDAARAMIGLRGSPAFSGIKPVAESLYRADRGGALNTRELLDIAGVLRCARRVQDYHNGASGERTAIDHHFRSLRGNHHLEERITSAILDEDEIADNASSELADIRRHKRNAAAKGRSILQKIVSSQSYSKVLQEAIITQRDGRFVVPVKAEFRSSMPGLVHDISSSGATIFVEPMGVVQANNELKELEAKEKKEIERILRELSAMAAGSCSDILSDYNLLVMLDLIFARGQLSYKMDGSRPEIRRNGSIMLRRACHPLLDSGRAVPIDIALGQDFDTLVITGPNTGGKTVSLKTLGLLTLMAQCGLHIPAASGSAVSVFDRVLADIGDEQSIEQSLSTFSAHMVNIVQILAEADGHSLILFDELGAGTDPVEGAALAIAIIQHVRDRGAKVAATTHYAELKTFAMTTAGVENASCEFDVETLRPTYKLLTGIPGKSNAFAISLRLGLDPSVIETAKAQMDSESIRFEDVLTQLEEKRQRLEKDQTEADRLLSQRESDAKRAREFREQMERAKENARTRGEAEARRIIREARAQADAIFEELNQLRRQQEKAVDWQGVNTAKAAIRGQLNQAEEELRFRQEEREPIPAPSRPVQAGDLVEFGRKQAVVAAVNGDRLQLVMGNMKLAVKAGDVRLIEEAEVREKKEAKRQVAVHTRLAGARAANNELDIRGMMTDEADLAVDQFLDNALMGKLNTVTIIHGKGTGALRKAVQQQLRRHPSVKGFRLGRYGEGEDGVTVVELKQ